MAELARKYNKSGIIIHIHMKVCVLNHISITYNK